MNVKIKKGDFVARKSYKQDVLFVVDKIINLKDGSAYVILKGVTIRIEADAPIEDIVRVDESKVTIAEKRIKNNKIEHRNNIIKNKNR